MSTYFSNLPNIEVGVPEGNSSLSNSVQIKNIFRRAKPHIENLRNKTIFEKYIIPGNYKPYQVSREIYGTVEYEWVILLVNDIHNVYTGWPLSSEQFEQHIKSKYGTKETETKYWETKEIKYKNDVILEAGLVVPQTFTYKLPNGQVLAGNLLVDRISHYEYEERINEQKRTIYLVYPRYMNQFIDEFRQVLQYDPNDDVIIQGLKSAGNESQNRTTNTYGF
jgi:hypothetical protein